MPTDTSSLSNLIYLLFYLDIKKNVKTAKAKYSKHVNQNVILMKEKNDT